MSENYDLQKSKKAVSALYPVIKDAHGNVIDGFHRLEADPNWKTETLEDIQTPVQLALARIVANTHRRQVSKEERKLQLVTLAEELVKEGRVREEVIPEIAELTTFDVSYLYKMLPAEYKSRPGVGKHKEKGGLSPPSEHEHDYDPATAKCKICGRELTAPESVKNGVGPICANGNNVSDVSNVNEAPERFPGEHAISQALGQTPKPLTVEEKAFKLLDEECTKFGDISDVWMIDTLKRIGIYLPESRNLAAKYRNRAKAKIPDSAVITAQTPAPTATVTAEPRVVTDPFYGLTMSAEKVEAAINRLEEALCTDGVLLPIQAEKVAEYLRRGLK